MEMCLNECIFIVAQSLFLFKKHLAKIRTRVSSSVRKYSFGYNQKKKEKTTLLQSIEGGIVEKTYKNPAEKIFTTTFSSIRVGIP